MSIFNVTTQNKLNELLEKAYDAEKGFTKAAESVDNTNLKAFFTRKAIERNRYRADLKNVLVNNGMKIKEHDGSITGSLHRAWMDTKAFLSLDNDESILEEVKNGEKAALNDYNDILENCVLDNTTRTVLIDQKNEILASYNRTNYLDDIQ